MHVVLVHGMGGTRESWASVTPLLDARGVRHTVADNLSQSLADDVANVESLIDAADAPVLLVGHSYGGAVITDAGRHPAVRGLVYVAAFVSDRDETVNEIVDRYPPAPVSGFFTRGPEGEWIPDDSERARLALAWDVPREIWQRDRRDRRRASNDIFVTPTAAPAWASRPSWYVLATRDQHIGAQTQRDMATRAGATIVETATSHAVPHADPAIVAETIDAAIDSLAGLAD